jgi:hypothetical protein
MSQKSRGSSHPSIVPSLRAQLCSTPYRSIVLNTYHWVVTLAEQIFGVIVLASAVASVSWTVTQEEIFREPRKFCEDRVANAGSIFARKFFYAFTCEYCFSHWATLVFLVLTGFRVWLDDWRGTVLAFFVIPWTANQFMSLYRRLRVEIKRENILAEKEETND